MPGVCLRVCVYVCVVRLCARVCCVEEEKVAELLVGSKVTGLVLRSSRKEVAAGEWEKANSSQPL